VARSKLALALISTFALGLLLAVYRAIEHERPPIERPLVVAPTLSSRAETASPTEILAARSEDATDRSRAAEEESVAVSGAELPGGTLVGRVVSRADRPRPPFEVSIMPDDLATVPEMIAWRKLHPPLLTSDCGDFVARGLEPGGYLLEIEAAEWLDSDNLDLVNTPGSTTTTSTFEMPDEERVEHTFEVGNPSLGIIRGVLQGMRHQESLHYEVWLAGFGMTSVDADGSFEFQGVTPGEWALRVKILPAPLVRIPPRRVVLAPGGREKVVIDLPPIRGKLFTFSADDATSGKDVLESSVIARPAADESVRSFDTLGSTFFLIEGEWVLAARARGYFDTDPLTLDVRDDGAAPATVYFELVPLPRYELRVVNAFGRAIPRHEVLIAPAGFGVRNDTFDQKTRFPVSLQTGARGECGLNTLGPGAYEIWTVDQRPSPGYPGHTSVTSQRVRIELPPGGGKVEVMLKDRQ